MADFIFVWKNIKGIGNIEKLFGKVLEEITVHRNPIGFFQTINMKRIWVRLVKIKTLLRRTCRSKTFSKLNKGTENNTVLAYFD